MLRPSVTALLILAGGAAAGEADTGSTFHGLQRDFEIGAHERLEALRRSPETALAPFETDGCSGGLSKIWRSVAAASADFAETHQQTPPWEGCCVTHDHDYHAAGADPDPDASYTARLRADERLEMCVAETGESRIDHLVETYGLREADIRVGYRNIASAMFVAVRLGGAPCTGLAWRWGYGYPSCGP